MAKIIAVAQNYAFGPIGKLLTINPYLKAAGYQIQFIGEGTAYQLGSKEPFDKIVHMDTDSKDFEKKMTNTFKTADVLLSCMDMASVRLAQKVGLYTIWLDTLFWWRNEIPDYILNVDCYIKQNSVKDGRNMRIYGPKVKNLKSVGPLVDLSVLDTKKNKNQVIVAFGGMEAKGWYKVGKETNYPFLIRKLLERIDFSEFENVIITGNERVIKQMDSKKKINKKFVFQTLPHLQFAQELANSKLAIMTPGLETPLEAFSYNVPTIFLPPSNASNYMQLNSFVKEGVATMKIHFTDYYDEIKMLNKGFRKRLSLYLDQLHVFEKDTKAQEDMIKRLNEFVKNRDLQNLQVSRQKTYISNHGNGVKDCLRIITDLLKTSRKIQRGKAKSTFS